jgi:hypothetical protein
VTTESSFLGPVRRLRGAGARIPSGPRWQRLYRALASTWVLGPLVAIASWGVTFAPPFVGLDESWWAALYMAAHRGLHFGSHLVFTYGPLGFLGQAFLWYGNVAALSFLYQVVLHLALSISLVWALRRTLNAAGTVVLAMLALLAAPAVDAPTALTAVWCLAALSPKPIGFATPLVLFGGAALGAVQTLVELRSGPVILVMCAVTLLAGEHRLRRTAIFVGCSAVGFVLLWFATGQGISNIPPFVENAAQIVSGYSEAMGIPGSALYLFGAVVLAVALVVMAAATSCSGRSRVGAVIVIGAACFSLFKEAVVRAGFDHAQIFFATASVVGAAIAFGRRRVLAIVTVTALGAINIGLQVHHGAPPSFNPITHVRLAVNQVRLLFSPRRRDAIEFFYAVTMVQTYRLSPATLRLLRGHTVYIDPWEQAVAWAYRLDWDPTPVFQNYSAYTGALDRLNSDYLRSPVGPQRILRENTVLVDPTHDPPSIDGRFPAWDPPGQSLAMLCNYTPLLLTARWQVLGKVASRCGTPELIRSLHTRYGATVNIPAPKPRGVLYAKIYGAGVSGLERIRTLLYRSEFRYLTVNGAARYRLVPGTAADGLIMATSPNVDYPGPYGLSPRARTIELTGVSGPLRIDLYWMSVSRR